MGICSKIRLCWVPPVAGDVFWSPGYVGWVRTPDYVAWVPLAPGERYYGRRYFGRNSVNISKEDVNRINFTNVYKNIYIDNGATIVNRNTFNTSSPTIAKMDRKFIQRNIFVHKNIITGAPDIKPTRSSYFFSDRPVPSAKLPPQRFRDIRSKELKHSRTLTRDPEISVLNPGARNHELPLNSVTRPRAPGMEKPAFKKVQPVLKGQWKGNGELGQTGERPRSRSELREKPAIPADTLPGGERPHEQPVYKGQPAVPVIPGPTEERPQSRPETREKPAIPAGTLPWSERPHNQPVLKGHPAEPVIPGPTGERSNLRPERRENPAVPAGTLPNGERPHEQPVYKVKPAAPIIPSSTEERPQSRNERREKPAIPATTLPGAERPHEQPVFKGQAATVIPGPTGERPHPHPERMEKPAIPAGPLPGGEFPQVRPKGINLQGVAASPGAISQKSQSPLSEKKKSGIAVEPGKRGGKKPGEPVEGQPKVQTEHGENME
jgi:hypothetical protein